MTAIVGLVQGGKVYIGGDSAGVAGLSLAVRADTKVFRKGRYLFGFTTSFRMGQLIEPFRVRLQVRSVAPGMTENAQGYLDTTK